MTTRRIITAAAALAHAAPAVAPAAAAAQTSSRLACSDVVANNRTSTVRPTAASASTHASASPSRATAPSAHGACRRSRSPAPPTTERLNLREAMVLAATNQPTSIDSDIVEGVRVPARATGARVRRVSGGLPWAVEVTEWKGH